MNIKLNDLAAQNREIRDEVESALARVHDRTAYVGGPEVIAFEREFASFLGVRHVVSVASGTDSLRMALLAIGVGAGDEVITSPMTFIATAAAIFQTGALPAFVDVDPDTGNLSAPSLRRYLEAGKWHTPNGPRAIVPVHLYGTPAPTAELGLLAEQYGLEMVEDACQAHGARIYMGEGWVMAGAMGIAGCFSFYPGKNLGAWGDGGAVATNDEEIASRVSRLRDHGRISRYAHEEIGYNSRLDTIQAVVLSAKLKHLREWNYSRRRIAAAYRRLLGSAVQLPSEPEGVESCYHQFVIRSERRDHIRQSLLMKQIECGIHYPVPLHLQPACRSLDYRKGDFPVSERMADTVLSLPIHPYLSVDEAARVAETVRSALEPEPARMSVI